MTKPISFSKVDDKNMEYFERQIVYLYGAHDIKPIVDNYINALKELENIGVSSSLKLLADSMLPFLEKCYILISTQTGLKFDITTAAKLELDLILAQANQASFEFINNIMNELYNCVLNSHSPNIMKAAMLRTFLYQYKIRILNSDKGITAFDINIMLEIDKESKRLLGSTN